MKKLLFVLSALSFIQCSSSKPKPLTMNEFRVLTPQKAIAAYGRPDTTYTEGNYTVMLYWITPPDSTIGTPHIEHTSNGLPFFLVPHPAGSDPDYRELAFNGDKMYKGLPSRADRPDRNDPVIDSLRRARGHR